MNRIRDVLVLALLNGTVFGGCKEVKAPLTRKDPEHRPQSPLLLDGALEGNYTFFYGRVGADGALRSEPPAGSTANPNTQIIGAIVNGNTVTRIAEPLTFKRQTDDPCPRDEGRTLVGTLPLYLVTNKDDINVCRDMTLTLASMSELARCDASADQEVQLNGFNRVHEMAVAVPGYWNSKGVFADNAPDGVPVVTIGCITGVVAKCAHWGYLPWVAYGAAPNLAPYHRMCVQAARAVYGTDKSDVFTCEGTRFDIFDDLNIQKKPSSFSYGETLESYWDEGGWKCISHSRYKACDGDFQLSPDHCASTTGWKIGVASLPDRELPWAPEICPESKGPESRAIACNRR